MKRLDDERSFINPAALTPPTASMQGARRLVMAGSALSIFVGWLVVGCSNGQSEVTTPEPATGSAGSAPLDDESCAATASSLQMSLFQGSCDGAGCHGGQAPAAGLDLLSGSLDALTTKSSALCSGWSLVVPGSPETSLLYRKLVGTPPCGEPMPLGLHLPESGAQCVATWIRGLAKDGGCETCGGSDCVALASNPQHCGGCGQVCPTGTACEDGACSCPGGGLVCDGVCVDTQTSGKHCGACARACGATAACIDGACVCAAGLTSCDDGCVDIASDPTNCGACGNACSAGTVCLDRQCSAGCGSLTQCGNSCVDTQDNTLNCGACGKACAAGLACSAGQCGCASGELCGSSCVDTTSDTDNCGKCGIQCGAGEACVDGSCSCAGSSAVSFKNDIAPLLETACSAAGCHSGTKPKEGLALQASVAYSELVGVAASQCGGTRKLVAPSDPSASYLMQKLLGVDVCTGTQMPKAGQTLPKAQLDSIGSWICAGAQNN